MSKKFDCLSNLYYTAGFFTKGFSAGIYSERDVKGLVTSSKEDPSRLLTAQDLTRLVAYCSEEAAKIGLALPAPRLNYRTPRGLRSWASKVLAIVDPLFLAERALVWAAEDKAREEREAEPKEKLAFTEVEPVDVKKEPAESPNTAPSRLLPSPPSTFLLPDHSESQEDASARVRRSWLRISYSQTTPETKPTDVSRVSVLKIQRETGYQKEFIERVCEAAGYGVISETEEIAAEMAACPFPRPLSSNVKQDKFSRRSAFPVPPEDLKASQAFYFGPAYIPEPPPLYDENRASAGEGEF